RRLGSLVPLALALAMALFPASSLFAQTTGGIVGRATDESGAVLPGVLVEASGPSLQGTRTATTDGRGNYRLTLLPPGSYTVTFSLEGFGLESKKGITVGLDKDSTLDAVMRPHAAETITVTGEAPVVDVTSTSLGTNLDSRSIETLPTGRNYSSVVQITPGVSSDANPDNSQQSTITVYGSSG